MKTSPKTIIRKKPPEKTHRLFAVCPGGLESCLKAELLKLDIVPLNEFPGGIEFDGTLEVAYRACLSLRVASRVLLLLHEINNIRTADDIYRAVRALDWTKVFIPPSTFAVYFTESHTQHRQMEIAPQFLALKAKDAIADCFREKLGHRPDVDRANADITIRLHLHNHTFKIYLDFSGASLHERGYRKQTGEAPLKENLAAGLIYLSGWADEPTVPFLDPFCGSGTLAIEAGLIATHTAPGLLRQHYGFLAWRDHQRSTYDQVRKKLEQKVIKDPSRLQLIRASDVDSKMIDLTAENVARAGLTGLIEITQTNFIETRPDQPKGLIIMNPPYGIRIGESFNLIDLYKQIGSTLKHQYKGWKAGVICSDLKLLQAISLKPSKKANIHNGAIETLFHVYDLF